MRVIRKLWGLLKLGVKKIIAVLTEKGPVEVIEDATKAVIGIASTGAVLYAGINAVRVALMKGKSSVKPDKSGNGDAMIDGRRTGSLDEKLEALRRQNHDINHNNPRLTQEDLQILEEVAKDRNSVFRMLSPEDQMNVLKTEGFDFEARRAKYRSRRKSHIRRSLRKVGEPTVGQPFRDPVDYGWLNFIMRPLDDFLCWLRNDPVPKRVKQIRLIGEADLKDLPCTSGDDAIRQLRSLNPYFDGTEADALLNSFEDNQERVICAEEIFRHRRLKTYRKAVNAKMLDSERGLSSQILDLMAEDSKKSKGKKKKKDKKKKSGGIVSYNPSGKKSKGKGDDKEAISDADREAQKMYNHFLKAVSKGESVWTGYHMDRIL